MSKHSQSPECAGGIIIFPNQTIILIERGSVADGTAGLAIPKGHWEARDGAVVNEESLRQTALREVWEETGHRGEIIRPLGGFYRDSTEHNKKVEKHITVFLMRSFGIDAERVPDESSLHVSLEDALSMMFFEKEEKFLADHADDIFEQTLRLAS